MAVFRYVCLDCKYILLLYKQHAFKSWFSFSFQSTWSHKMIFKISLCGSGLVTKLCQILATPWTVAHQAPLCMGFSRPEYQRGLPFPSPVYLPDPGIETTFPALRADSLPLILQGRLKLLQTGLLLNIWLIISFLKLC